MKTKWILRFAALALCGTIFGSCGEGDYTGDTSIAGSVAFTYHAECELYKDGEFVEKIDDGKLRMNKLTSNSVNLEFHKLWHVYTEDIVLQGKPYDVQFSYSGSGRVQGDNGGYVDSDDVWVEGWMRDKRRTRNEPATPHYNCEIYIKFKYSDGIIYEVKITGLSEGIY